MDLIAEIFPGILEKYPKTQLYALVRGRKTFKPRSHVVTVHAMHLLGLRHQRALVAILVVAQHVRASRGTWMMNPVCQLEMAGAIVTSGRKLMTGEALVA